MARLVGRALDLVPPDSHEAGRLLSLHGSFLGTEEGDYDGAQEAFSRALDIAHRLGDMVLQMPTLAGASRVDNYYGRPQESLKKALQAIELARIADDPSTELDSHRIATQALTRMGNLEDIGQHASAMLPLAERLRDRWWLAGTLFTNERMRFIEGDWQADRHFSDRGLAVLSTDLRFLCPRAVL